MHFDESPFAKAAGSCTVPTSCTTNDAALDAAIAERIKSTARLLFTDGGSAFVCSGTLLNTERFPAGYLLTANHCVSTPAIAGSVSTFWFYDSTSCTDLTIKPTYIQKAGGTQLVFTNYNPDQTLLLMPTAPPAGTVYAGWNADRVLANESIVSISYPKGDASRLALGAMKTEYRITDRAQDEYGEDSFTAGIGVIIFVGQWQYFFGLEPAASGAHFLERFLALVVALPTLHLPTMGLGLFTLAVLVTGPRLLRAVPAPLLAMVSATLLQAGCHFPGVATIGTAFGGIPRGLPAFALPSVSLAQVISLVGPAFAIAFLTLFFPCLFSFLILQLLRCRLRSGLSGVSGGRIGLRGSSGRLSLRRLLKRLRRNLRRGGFRARLRGRGFKAHDLSFGGTSALLRGFASSWPGTHRLRNGGTQLLQLQRIIERRAVHSVLGFGGIGMGLQRFAMGGHDIGPLRRINRLWLLFAFELLERLDIEHFRLRIGP